MTTVNNVTVTEPNDQEIISWWTWAAKFVRDNSPFELGWAKGEDRNDQGQLFNIFCLSCTAGRVGPDPEVRPLDAALASGKDVLVPVIVACGDTLGDAKTQLGNPNVQFFVNGNPQESFYKETLVPSVNFPPNNTFEEQPGVRPVYSVGYWAKVSPTGLLNLQFGGTGGTVTLTDNSEFKTLVSYE